jgi:HSP20 family protein
VAKPDVLAQTGEPLPVAPPAPERPPLVFAPPLDIHETPEGLVLEADLPGVAPEDLQLQVQNNVLHILGRVTWPVPADARPLHEEVPRGDFYRSFILSEEVDTEKIQADFSDGILRLTLPRVERARPRKIEIRTPGKPAGA